MITVSVSCAGAAADRDFAFADGFTAGFFAAVAFEAAVFAPDFEVAVFEDVVLEFGDVLFAAGFLTAGCFSDGFDAAVFLVEDFVEVFLVAVADTVLRRLADAVTLLRPAESAAETTTVTPSWLSCLSRALLCDGESSARSHATRTSAAVTFPDFLPRSNRSCRSG
ncbi:MAG: hypothetical protein ACRDOY_02965 [Nocardioidaceae bacterium]